MLRYLRWGKHGQRKSITMRELSRSAFALARSDTCYHWLSCEPPSICAVRCTTSCRWLRSDACKHAVVDFSACPGTVSVEPPYLPMELFGVTFARHEHLMSVTVSSAFVLVNKLTCYTGLRSRQMCRPVDGNLIAGALGVVPRVRPAQAVNTKPSFLRSSLVLLLLLNRTLMVGSLPASCSLPMQSDTAYL